MDFNFLKSLKNSYGGDVEMCKTAMLHSWLETGKATKSSLIDALTGMNEGSIAAKLQ